jgi:hypothetical protein
MAGKDVNTFKVFLFSFTGAAVIAVIVLTLGVMYHVTVKRLEFARNISQPYEETDKAVLDQLSRLQEYERVADVDEQGKKREAYRIPIDRAMEKVLADWRSGALPGPVVEIPADSTVKVPGSPASPQGGTPAPAAKEQVKDGKP